MGYYFLWLSDERRKLVQFSQEGGLEMTVGPDLGMVGCIADERGPTAFHSWSSEADDGEICLLITDAIRQHFFEYADSSWQNLICISCEAL